MIKKLTMVAIAVVLFSGAAGWVIYDSIPPPLQGDVPSLGLSCCGVDHLKVALQDVPSTVETDVNPAAIDNGAAQIDAISVPETKDDCKNIGWQNLFRTDGTPFENQGNCIQYVKEVNTGK